MAELSQQQWATVDSHLFAGRKIQAIKAYREATRCGLAEAKNAVDDRDSRLRQEQPGQFSAPAGKSGCFGAVLIGISLAAAALVAATHLLA